MTEYAIIAGLIAIVSLPALFMLSDGVNDLFGNMFNGEQMQALATAKSNTGTGSGGTNAEATAIDQALADALTSGDGLATYDPSTGQMTIMLPPTSGGGTTTASVSGGELVATLSTVLKDMADNYKDANGEPLPPLIQAYLYELSKKANELAAAQLMDPYPSIGDKAKTYGDLFMKEWKENVMEDSYYASKYGDLINMVNVYSGIISDATHEIILDGGKNLPPGESWTSNDGSYQGNFVKIGEYSTFDVSSMTDTQAQAVTDQSADAIGGLADTGTTTP